jgi:hypothetical protein
LVSSAKEGAPLDWYGLVVGAVLGAVVGILVENILFPSLKNRWTARQRRAFYIAANNAWAAIERLYPSLALVQAGWASDGYFPNGTITLRLGASFKLKNESVARLREDHANEWARQGFTDGEQIGISSISIVRTSDEPTSQTDMKSHHLQLLVHRYRYFDFLATHVLRLRGTEEERSALNSVVGRFGPHTPVDGFPNPCSVGLSLFCEGGTQLALLRRSDNSGSGGWWASEKIYNAVGEGVAGRDFSAMLDGSYESTPDTTGKRGLYEELGFSVEDIEACAIHIHSFAWSSELLDHKFFGLAISPLSCSEAQERWRNAHDRPESTGTTMSFYPTTSRVECMDLVTLIRDHPDDWSPEAIFATIRSLLTLRRIKPGDLAGAFSRARRHSGSQQVQGG